MQAVAYEISLPISDPQSLKDVVLPKPKPSGKELLVEVHAVSVNPVDVKIRVRVSPEAGAPKVLGWDCAGIVVAVGEDVTRFNVGDRVFYAGEIEKPGTNSQYHIVDEDIVGPMPSGVDFAAAAALPLTSITAWEALFDRLDVNRSVPGGAGAVVVIGGAGGVGSIAIQLLRALTNLTVIATASRAQSQEWVREMGAHYVIDHSQPLAPQIEALGVGQPEFVFSTTHTEDYITDIAELIAPQGRLALIDDPEVFDITPFKAKSVSVHWELMFTRSLYGTADKAMQHGLLNEVSRLVDAGKIRSTVTKVLSPINASNLRNAHALLESNRMLGKLVLVGWQSED